MVQRQVMPNMAANTLRVTFSINRDEITEAVPITANVGQILFPK